MSFAKIIVAATVAANTQKAWDYYTMPEHIVNWNFASDDWHCPKAENDVRVGGKMNSRMEAKDGSFGFDFEVIYSAVENLKHLAYIMEDGRQATIDFVTIDGKTTVTVVFDAETENSIELQKGGWQAILNNYAKYVEGN